MAGPALTFDGIGMTFPDGTRAIAEVSFSLAPREFVTIVGPSGCGKSTLLRIAAGLLEPTVGRVEIDRDHLGYVFQDPTLLPWRTVRQNVELLAELRGLRPAGTGAPGPGGDRPGRADRVRGPLPEVAVGWHEDALLARPQPHPAPAGVPVRRAVRRRRRDHPRAPQRADPGPVPGRGVRRVVHHPLHRRGRVHEHAGDRDVAASRPDRRRVRRALRLPAVAGAALRP